MDYFVTVINGGLHQVVVVAAVADEGFGEV